MGIAARKAAPGGGRAEACMPVRRALLALAVAALGACATRPVVPFDQGDSRYRFDCTVERSNPGVAAMVRVTDLASARWLATPRVELAMGQSASVNANDEETGAALLATVTASADGASAACVATLRKGTQLIASYADTVSVR